MNPPNTKENSEKTWKRDILKKWEKTIIIGVEWKKLFHKHTLVMLIFWNLNLYHKDSSLSPCNFVNVLHPSRIEDYHIMNVTLWYYRPGNFIKSCLISLLLVGRIMLRIAQVSTSNEHTGLDSIMNNI